MYRLRLPNTSRSHRSGRLRKLDVAAVVGAIVAGVFLVPGSAAAGDTQDAPVTKVSTVDASVLLKAARPGNAINKGKEPKLKARVDGHLDKLARAGRLSDAREIEAAAVPDPQLAGQEIELVWSKGKVPHQVTVASADRGDDSYRAFGSIFLDDTSAAGQVRPAGNGYDWGHGVNMYRWNYGCIEQWWDSYTATFEDHYLWSCWEKWAEAGTNHWVYNRWGRFSRANPDHAFPYTREVTLRSRPWSGSDKITSLNAATPAMSATTCEETGSINIGYGYGGGNAAVTVPLHRCSDVHPVGAWSRKEIGVQFYGWYTGRVMYVDMAGDYSAKDSIVVPVWADYAWVGVIRTGPWGTQILDEYVRKDSGW